MYLSYYTGYWFEGGGQGETVSFFKERMYFNLPVKMNTCKFKKRLLSPTQSTTLWCQVRVILALS